MTQTNQTAHVEALYTAVELALAAAPDWGAEEGAESIFAGMDGQGRPVETWSRRIGWSFARRARAAADLIQPGLLRGDAFPTATTTEELAEFACRAVAALAPFSPSWGQEEEEGRLVNVPGAGIMRLSTAAADRLEGKVREAAALCQFLGGDPAAEGVPAILVEA